MQYKNYEIQYVDYGIIVRDSKGEFVTSADTEEEAIQCIEDIIVDEQVKQKLPVDWYNRFKVYCRNMAGICYPFEDDKFATIYEKALKGYAKSFEKENNVTVKIAQTEIDGEAFYYVEDVY